MKTLRNALMLLMAGVILSPFSLVFADDKPVEDDPPELYKQTVMMGVDIQTHLADEPGGGGEPLE